MNRKGRISIVTNRAGKSRITEELGDTVRVFSGEKWGKELERRNELSEEEWDDEVQGLSEPEEEKVPRGSTRKPTDPSLQLPSDLDDEDDDLNEKKPTNVGNVTPKKVATKKTTKKTTEDTA